jgi:rare lipoprotein A
MNAALLQRQAALAGVALLGALGAVALGNAGEDSSVPDVAAAPEPRVGWENGRVSVLDPGRIGEQTSCGVTLTATTLGVAHSVLPCGVELVLSAQGREVKAEVVEQGGVGQGLAFVLTPALAEQLGVAGTQRIRWRFAA